MQEIVTGSTQSLDDFSALTEQERHKIVVEWNDTTVNVVPTQKRDAMPAAGFAYASTLKRFLQEKLPNYMVPAVFVILDSLPLTPNGKVDRRNLPAPDRSRPDLEETFVAPRNLIEEMLAVIWAELLGLEQIGVHDNFFNLGGHSLIAAQILSRVRDVFQVELSFQNIFANPTVAGLAQLIEQHSHVEQQLQVKQKRLA